MHLQLGFCLFCFCLKIKLSGTLIVFAPHSKLYSGLLSTEHVQNDSCMYFLGLYRHCQANWNSVDTYKHPLGLLNPCLSETLFYIQENEMARCKFSLRKCNHRTNMLSLSAYSYAIKVLPSRYLLDTQNVVSFEGPKGFLIGH